MIEITLITHPRLYAITLLPSAQSSVSIDAAALLADGETLATVTIDTAGDDFLTDPVLTGTRCELVVTAPAALSVALCKITLTGSLGTVLRRSLAVRSRDPQLPGGGLFLRAETLRWRGEYNAGAGYIENDLVTSGGSAWRAKRPVSGVAPAIGADWDVYATDTELLIVEVAGTVEIGGVDTVDSDQPASVVNVGTAQNAILNINIPRGLTGNLFKAYATLALAQEDLANIPADAPLRINADPTPANNGDWAKTGGVLVQSSWDRVALVEKRTTSLEVGRVTQAPSGKNLIDLLDIYTGFFLLNTGALSASSIYVSTGFIAVDRTVNTNVTANNLTNVIQYDQTKALIAGSYVNNGPGGVYTVALLANTAYIRISYFKSTPLIQLEYGAVATSYEVGHTEVRTHTGKPVFAHQSLHSSDETASNVARLDGAVSARRHLDVPLRPPHYTNGVRHRYGVGTVQGGHGFMSGTNAVASYAFNQTLLDIAGEPNAIKVVGVDQQYNPTYCMVVTPESLVAMGVTPDDVTPPMISMMAAFLVDSLVNQTKASLQVWWCLRYSDTVALSPNYNAAADVMFNKGAAVASYFGLGDTLWNHSASAINDVNLFGWKHEGVPVPATYLGKPFRGIIITFHGYAPTTTALVPIEFQIGRVAVVAGSSVSVTGEHKNYPEDYTLISDGTVPSGSVTLANVDRIGFLGDSFTESYYALKDKAYISKISQFLDYTVENFAISGETYPLNQSRILTSAHKFHGSLSWRDYNCAYAVLISATNDLGQGATLDQYIENLRAIAETVRGMGAEPIVSSEFADYQKSTIGMKLAADRLGVRFMNILPITKNLDMTKHLPFWGSGHPATRTNALLAEPLLAYLSRLPRPKQSIKIYRLRSTVPPPASVDDVLYSNIPGRIKIWKEISIGHTALSTASSNKYDELSVLTGVTYQTVVSEYLSLQNKQPVAFGNYALIEAVLPLTARGLQSLKLRGLVDGLTVYARDVLAAPYQSGGIDGKPEGHYVQMISDGSGGYSVPAASVPGCLQYDKASFLIYKPGGFTLADLAVDWTGIEGKSYAAPNWERVIANGAELLAQPLLGTVGEIAAWTLTGAPVTAVPTDTVVPRGTTGCTTVSTLDKVAQAFVVGLDDYTDRPAQIRLWARYFPAVFNSGDVFPDAAPITLDTTDYATLIIDIITGGKTFKTTALVGLHWQEVLIDTLILSGTTDYSLAVYSADLPIQISKVSTKLF